MSTPLLRRIGALLGVLLLGCAAALGAPRVLIVVAHPDDETCFAATTYRIAKELGGTVDQLVITNGEGGYRYSLLGAKYYGIDLTNEAVGRKYLPDIRKQELLNTAKVLGIGNHFFLDEPDPGYTQDVHEAFAAWDHVVVKQQIQDVLARGHYDFVFTLLPTAGTHGHHKAATIFAINMVTQIPEASRPVVLGCTDTKSSQPEPAPFAGLDRYPETKPLSGAPVFRFDREVKFGFRDSLDYQIVVNWAIAEHKSQGLLETGFNRVRYENFYVYQPDGAAGVAKTKALFEQLTPKPNDAH